jgi:hypothetical protein
MMTIREIQQRAYIPLFGQKCCVHWTDSEGLVGHRGYYGPEGGIIQTGYLEEGTSFTTSLDLAFPLDNRAPYGMVFPIEPIRRLGYHNFPENQEGITAMEIVYEISGDRRVPLTLMVGEVAYDRRVLERFHRVLPGYPQKLVHRPRYSTFDFPRQWEKVGTSPPWGGRWIDLPEPA